MEARLIAFLNMFEMPHFVNRHSPGEHTRDRSIKRPSYPRTVQLQINIQSTRIQLRYEWLSFPAVSSAGSKLSNPSPKNWGNFTLGFNICRLRKLYLRCVPAHILNGM